jgi:hypothetical protein
MVKQKLRLLALAASASLMAGVLGGGFALQAGHLVSLYWL